MDGVDEVSELRQWKIYVAMLSMMLINIFRFRWNILYVCELCYVMLLVMLISIVIFCWNIVLCMWKL
jgi:hypothetical protein